MERDVDVWEEDLINIKMEEVFTPSVCIIKTEHEVSVVCWCIFVVANYLHVYVCRIVHCI